MAKSRSAFPKSSAGMSKRAFDSVAVADRDTSRAKAKTKANAARPLVTPNFIIIPLIGES
jgi:hypothetical protein